MPRVTVIVGGQWGSEGKGAIAAHLANEFQYAVRVGGPNAGHTFYIGDEKHVVRQIPCASYVNPLCIPCIGAGGIIDLKVLQDEIVQLPDGKKLMIDRNAGILEDVDLEEERDGSGFKNIGSTSKGVGAALRRKILREGFRTAQQIPELQKYVTHVADWLNRTGSRVMIEGTQGHGLSLDHGPYPFCTSRNVLASSLLGDVGLGPNTVEDVILVVRTFPIRVFGNSGPMYGEMNWEALTRISGSPAPLEEKTTVTNRVRRVGQFDWHLFDEACVMNTPTKIALTFADYLDYKVNFGVTSFDALAPHTRRFVESIEKGSGIPVAWIKTGPKSEHIIDRRENK